MKRLTLLLALLLLLTACQSAPPASTESVSSPQTGSGNAAPAPAESVEETDPPAPGPVEGSRPLQTAEEKTTVKIPETPDTASFFLTRWDGEQVMKAFCYSAEDRAALAEALPEIQGYAVLENRAVSKDPWPVYLLEAGGMEEDFVASYVGGIWRDNQGNVLSADVDFDGLWERFGSAEESVEGRLVNRELALAGGNWDARFMGNAESREMDPLISLETFVFGDNLGFCISNQSGHDILIGNDYWAVPQVQIADKWYEVPMTSGKHFVNTLEGINIRPGGLHDGIYRPSPIRELPDGSYRLVVPYSVEKVYGDSANERTHEDGIAAAAFSVRNGKFVTEGLNKV